MELKIIDAAGVAHWKLVSLRRAHAFADKYLGLDQVGGSVGLVVTREPPAAATTGPPCPHCGVHHAPGETTVMGATAPVLLPDRTALVKINDNPSAALMVRTLFHEMAHVVQIVADRLIPLPGGAALWERRHCRVVVDYQKEHDAYEAQPWEVEAREKEELMTKAFVRELALEIGGKT